MSNASEEPLIIIADDEPDARDLLINFAKDAGLEPIVCRDAQGAIEAIELNKENRALVGVATDLRMPGVAGGATGGWEVISHAYEASKSLRLALCTGKLEADLQIIFRSNAAVPAFEVFLKPGDHDKLATWMQDLRAGWDESFSLALRDASTRQIYEALVPTYAPSTLAILLLGESGTGKEGLAAHIHTKSARAGPFVPVNSGGLESEQAFSELFGRAADAFTGASQHALGKILEASGYQAVPKNSDFETFSEWFKRGNPDFTVRDQLLTSRSAESASGTLFLDEVATLPPRVMAGLLRVLETGEVIPFGHNGRGIKSHCRIIAATNELKVIGGAVETTEDRNFRPDLFYRLAGAIFTLSPLRERDAEDIRIYLRTLVWQQLSIPAMEVTRKASQCVVELYQDRNDATARQYQRGNFRTLRNLAYRAYLIARAEGSRAISEAHIELAIEHGQIMVPSVTRGGDTEHIRNVFKAALRERQKTIRDGFSMEDLKEITMKYPIETAFAFLRSTLIERDAGSDKKYFSHNEVEAALLQGRNTRNSYLTKTLLIEHIRTAAEKYLSVKLPEEQLPRIRDVVRAVQSQHAGNAPQ